MIFRFLLSLFFLLCYFTLSLSFVENVKVLKWSFKDRWRYYFPADSLSFTSTPRCSTNFILSNPISVLHLSFHTFLWRLKASLKEFYLLQLTINFKNTRRKQTLKMISFQNGGYYEFVTSLNIELRRRTCFFQTCENIFDPADIWRAAIAQVCSQDVQVCRGNNVILSI